MNSVSPDRPETSSEALVTVRIGKGAAAAGLVVLAVLCALIVADLLNRAERPAPTTSEAGQGKATAATSSPVEKRAAANNSAPPSGPVASPARPEAPAENEWATRNPIRAYPSATGEGEQLARSAPAALLVAPFEVGPPDRASLGIATLHGAGATFPYPLYARWFSEYHKLQPQTDFTYQALGSGAGIRQVIQGTVDFGASDVPMTDDQLSQATTKILHVPTVLGGVVPIYNVPGAGELRFTPEILAGIFLGKIVSWNDPAIRRANPAVPLANLAITAIHRSDGCATTFVFTDYLSKASVPWRDSSGKGTSVRWPAGFGAKGDAGVAASVEHVEGAIGYVDFLYAEQSHLAFGRVRNQSGKYLKANLENLTAAGAWAGERTTDFRVSITNAPGADAYPIASFTWLLVPQESKDPLAGRNLEAFLDWMITDGQTMTGPLGYAPLPGNAVATLRRTLGRIH